LAVTRSYTARRSDFAEEGLLRVEWCRVRQA